jgi:hypothetical protein
MEEIIMTNKLPQLANSVEIVGTLKSMDLAIKESKNKKNYVKGKVIVLVREDEKVHEHEVEIFQMESSKLFKGIKTMMNEYKTLEVHGEEADRIRVTGEVEINEYYNKEDELKSFNQIKGVFFNRLEADDTTPDKAIASVEVVVKGFAPKIIEETGEIEHYNVSAFTIGYGEKVIELKRAIVSDALAGPMQDLYHEGATGRLTFKLNRYAEKKQVEAQEPVSMAHGFGSEETVEATRVFERTINNYEITGGDVPFDDEKALDEEQIADAARKLALAREELKASRGTKAPDTPATNKPTGFGGNVTMPANLGKKPAAAKTIAPIKSAPTSTPTDLEEDEMPDF